MDTTRIERASPADLSRVQDLLEGSSLPTEDVENHFSSFLLAKQNGAVVACGGAERYQDGTLLRSLAVVPGARGKGIGSAIIRALVREEADRGIRHLYLLTTLPSGFFERFGFVRMDRADVPESIRSSVEFTSSCPASAAVYRLEISSFTNGG